MTEAKLIHRIQLAAARAGVRLFRNNIGRGYLGEMVTVLPNGDVVLRNWRRVQFGLCPGSPDLVGWRGYRGVAQFVALEVKTPAVSVTREQRAFLRAVADSGGVAAVPRSLEAAIAAVTGPAVTR